MMKSLITIFLLCCLSHSARSQTPTKTIHVEGKSYLVTYDQYLKIEPAEDLAGDYKEVRSSHERNFEFRFADKDQPHKTAQRVLGEQKTTVLAKENSNFLVFQFIVKRDGEVISARVIASNGLAVELEQLAVLVEELKEQVRFEPLPKLKEDEVITVTQLYKFSNVKARRN